MPEITTSFVDKLPFTVRLISVTAISAVIIGEGLTKICKVAFEQFAGLELSQAW